MPILAPSLPNPSKKRRQIFVAYPYKLYDTKDYRRPYKDVESAFGVTFVFADQKITDLHILQKIHNYIRESNFSIFDISGWNPNVTLELGLALGLSERSFIAFDPTKTELNEVPSDLRGVDRIQYQSFAQLSDELAKLLSQEYPVTREHEAESQIEALRSEATKLVDGQNGLRIGDIAQALSISVDLAKLVVKPLIGHQLELRGATRAAKYFPLAEN